MFGSASHLGRTGTSAYARDWVDVVARSSSTWRGTLIFPLFPIITSECPGPIIRELCEVSMWLDSVYESNPQGMHDVWTELIAAMETCSMGGIALDVMEAYKVIVPSSLSAPQLDNVMTFCSHNSRPITCKGLSKDRCGELLGTLLNHIHVNFRACTSPENFLVRADVSNRQIRESRRAEGHASGC